MRVLEEGALLADRYTLVRRLGSGGMSETWLANDRRTGKSVALKFLASGLAARAGYRKLFHNEWQLGSRLMHANIIRVFEYHDDADGPFFGLQYLSGPDVSVLAGEDLGIALRPIGLIADALRYAHGKNVVHGDIKAANVLLDERGAPYLIDFGGGASPVAASPQRLAGESPQPQDDIYSLGVLIFELISGGPPGKGARLRTARDGSPVPAKVGSLVEEMLAPDPGSRPGAESVANRLSDAGFPPGPVPARYLGNVRSVDVEPIEPTIRRVEHMARPRDGGARQPEEQTGVSPRVLGAALFAAFLVLLAVVFVLPRYAAMRDADSPEETATATNRRATLPKADENILFNENIAEVMGRDERVRLKQEAERALGELLSKLETLEARAVARWGGQIFENAQAVYAAGDQAFLRRNWKLAGEKYREAISIIDPLLDRVDIIFEDEMQNGRTALDAGDSVKALAHYELAVAISPGHAEAHNGLARAKNFDLVMSLTRRGAELENDLDLEAARTAFEKALDLDPEWQPAVEGLQRALVATNELSFDQRMSEGLEALADGDFPAARAAFRTAQALQPDSREPADGLLQVDQGIRLQRIAALERDAKRLEDTEQWDAAIRKYNAILDVDADLTFAHEGLARASGRHALHVKLEGWIADPDSLSEPSTMQAATTMLLDITRMPSVGPRLEDQKNQLSRLLKRAVTPLTVRLISDNATDVVIFRVGKLGRFESREITFQPGTYVAVGSRTGYRDVRLEFRVSPEIELQPVVVRCEERI